MDASPATRQRGRAPALAFIFATAVMDVMSLGVMVPVLPNLIKEFAGGDTALAAEWNVLFSTAWGLMQFVFSPVLGMLSDRFGRRPVILISIFGLGVDYLFMAFAPGLWWLFMGRVIGGVTAASFSTASAYVADITPPDQRAKAFGLMGAAFGIGFTLGPGLGGWLAEYDLRLPFFVCAGLAGINWLYGLFVLPESLPLEQRAKSFDLARANPVGSLRLLRSHPELMSLASVGFLFMLAHNVLPAIFALYTGHRYGWTTGMIGLSIMGTGVSNIIVQALLVGPALKRFGERGALLAGLAFGTAGFLVFAIAPTGALYLLGIPVFALTGLIQPGMQALMTRRVGAHEQGQLQGANASMMGIASLIGPSLFGLTFAWSVQHEAVFPVPGLAILIAAGCLAAGLAIAARAARPQEQASD